jgi:hypothetical protein
MTGERPVLELDREQDAARRGEGETLFDVLVAIIREHRPGADPGHGVELELL